MLSHPSTAVLALSNAVILKHKGEIDILMNWTFKNNNKQNRNEHLIQFAMATTLVQTLIPFSCMYETHIHIVFNLNEFCNLHRHCDKRLELCIQVQAF